MSDPVTFGALVASALSMAGKAMLNGVVGEATKDAYKALKERTSRWINNDLSELERAPHSAGRQAVIAETINRLSLEDQEMLRVPTQMLFSELKEAAPAVGLDIDRLHALEVQLGNITVARGIGTRIGEVDSAGTFKVGDIAVGVSSGKQ